MSLNPFVWELYRETPTGQLALDYFTRLPETYQENLQVLTTLYHGIDA